jgi:uncharacterized repeat protein (TIGR02543 family)
MKKMLSVIFIALMLLASCNLATNTSSTVTTSSSASASSSSVSSSTQPALNSISIATTSSLIQFVGLTSTITVQANVVGNVTSLEWYVNDVKSLTQTGLAFEFLPTAANQYVIQARSNSIVSNNLTLVVSLPQLNVTSVSELSASSLEIVGEAGLSFSIPGLTIANTSTYSLSRGRYTINLLTPMIQGTTYRVEAIKSGYRSVITDFKYETRRLNISYLLFDDKRVTATSDGLYVLSRPFSDTSTPASKEYIISLVHTNLEGLSVPVSVITNVPAGAAIQTPYQSADLVQRNVNINRPFQITSNTTLGIYEHNFTVDGVQRLVRVQIVAPTPTITISSPVVYDDAVVSGSGYTPMTNPFGKDVNDEYIKNVLTPRAGTVNTYVIKRPYNGPAKELTFIVNASNFATPLGFPEVGNPYSLLAALSGPSGGVMYYGTSFNTVTPSFPFRTTTGNNYRVTQYVDNKTALGTYTYTYTTVGGSASVTRTINIIVEEFAPRIIPIISTVIDDEGDLIVEEVKPNSDGSFTLFKPLSGNVIGVSVELKVENYESPKYTEFLGGEGTDTLYDVDGAGSDTMLRYLLNYVVNYSGPLSGVASLNSKVGVELGSTNAADTVTTQASTPATFKRFKGEGNTLTLDLLQLPTNATSIFKNFEELTTSTFPGSHNFNVRLGRYTTNITLRIENPQPNVILKADSIKFGPTIGSVSVDQVEFDEILGKYKVIGVGNVLDLKIYPFGMVSGNYSYNFVSRTPSGAITNVNNIVALSLKDDPYDGTLNLPDEGTGSEMRIIETLEEEGEYTFTFTINGKTLNVAILVLANPQLKLNDVTYNNVSLTSFDEFYFIENSDTERFIEMIFEPRNIKETYTYVINDNGEFLSGQALTDAREEIAIVDGKVVIGVTKPESSDEEDEVFTYFVSLYEGSVRVGEITKVQIISRPTYRTVFFNSNGGTSVSAITDVVGTNSVTEPADPTRVGYTFEGWYDNAQLSGSVLTFPRGIPANNIIYYAKWETIEYTITYDLDGGVNYEDAPTTFTIEDEIILGTPTRATYDFVGWALDEEGDELIESIERGTSDDVELFAIWELAD